MESTGKNSPYDESRGLKVQTGTSPCSTPRRRHAGTPRKSAKHKGVQGRSPKIAPAGGTLLNKLRLSFREHGCLWLTVATVLLIGAAVGAGVVIAKNRPKGNSAQDLKTDSNGSAPKSVTSVGPSLDTLLGDGQVQCSSIITDKRAFGTIARGEVPPPVTLAGGRIVHQTTGKEVVLHGVNWFGFNNAQTFLDGLWAGNTSDLGDFDQIARQIKLLGFNAVRLPFKFTDLMLKPLVQAHTCTWMSDRAILDRLTDPQLESPPPANTIPLTDIINRNISSPMCNGYVPEDNVLTRYLWTLVYLVRRGFYVLLDYHPQGAEDVVANRPLLRRYWVSLWSHIACLPMFQTELQGRLFLDLLNEPDIHGIGWKSNRLAALGTIYIDLMDNIDAKTPGAPIFFIQGGGQARLGISWGDGFVTDQTLIRQRRLDDPNPFFQQLLTKSYRDRVVLAPHLYGHSVTKTTEVGKLQFDKYSASFGELQKKGYCNANGSVCQRFPVVPGEIGSRFEDPHDVQYYEDMVRYFKLQGDGDDGRHEEMRSYFYWAYNGNSHDVGGLVTDDWTKVEWTKIRFLVNNLGLKPWYLQQ